jgi:DNA-binding transcriptional regulator YdaS (Cro superfamily)
MNCAERLVALFGSQAEVARRFRLDRAVVNNWVKSGYVPARWAMEVEHVTTSARSTSSTKRTPANRSG